MWRMNVELCRIKDCIDYNPVTGEFTWVNVSKYHSDLIGKPCGVVCKSRNKKYLVIQIDNKKYRAHRLAWIMTYGYIPNVVDHINGDSLDNRIVNLRDVTFLENSQNHLKHNYDTSTKKSGLPVGVKALPSGMFQSRITFDGKSKALGAFPTADLAHARYMEERIKRHDCPTIK